MFRVSQGLKRVFGGLFRERRGVLRRARCSDIRPEPNDEGGGVLELPTHEQDTVHEEEQRHEERR